MLLSAQWRALGVGGVCLANQEQFLKQDDFLAFSHRLNLMTYQACDVTAAH